MDELERLRERCRELEEKYHRLLFGDTIAFKTRAETAERELDAARRALERLASMEAFTAIASRDMSHPEAIEMNARIDFARAARAALGPSPEHADEARDAARYRWLRGLYSYAEWAKVVGRYGPTGSPKQIDAAIDAAMAALQGAEMSERASTEPS